MSKGMFTHQFQLSAKNDERSFCFLHGFIIFAYAGLLSFPVLWWGLVIGHDGLSHLVMSQNFVKQFWAGDIYPRWIFDANAGLGSPVFYFYGPIPYYFTALAHPFFSGDAEGWRQLGLSSFLAIALSGLSAYSWVKNSAAKHAALCASIVYMSAPYHLAMDLYTRFAFAELWGFVWSPFLFVYSKGIIAGEKNSIIWFAVAYALLILTHLPTLLILSPVVFLYALYMAFVQHNKKHVLNVIAAFLLGIGLSSFYFVPAMLEQGNVLVEGFVTQHLHYNYHFLFYGQRFDAVTERLLESLSNISAVMIAISGLCWVFIFKMPLGCHRREGDFWVAVALMTLLVMLPLSKPLWELLPIMQKVQFPWRFNIVLTLACTMLIALCLDYSRQQWVGAAKTSVVFISMAVLIFQSVPSVLQGFVMGQLIGTPTLDRLAEMSRKFGNKKLDVNLAGAKIGRYDSFVPKWVDPEVFGTASAANNKMKALGAGGPRASFASGDGFVDVVSWGVSGIFIKTHANRDSELLVKQFYYPGWSAKLNGTDALHVAPSRKSGLLSIKVPAGVNNIQLEMKPTTMEYLGQAISLISFAIACAVWLMLRRDKQVTG